MGAIPISSTKRLLWVY